MSWNFFDAWVPKRTSHKAKPCTFEEMKLQETKCSNSYEKWKSCVDTKGFNDSVCREKLLEKYYSCVSKLKNMKVYLEDKDLST